MKTTYFLKWRFNVLLLFLCLSVLILICRVVQLSILNQSFLKQQGDERVLRLSTRLAFRGMILDRNGYPLAVSTSVSSIWVNPQKFHADDKTWKELSALLQINTKAIKKSLNLAKSKKRGFFYLKRNLPPDIAHQIMDLKIPYLYTEEGYRRYYPEGETTAQLIGLTNIDDRGQEGVEFAYNDWLSGIPEKKWIIQDRLGRNIADVKQVQASIKGKTLKLSIDRRIQYLAYRALMDGVYQNQAESGSLVIIDVDTGEVLALVNYPSFNPNIRTKNQLQYAKNIAITNLFEPGSTIKAFTIASALDSGKYTKETIVDTSPIKIGRKLIQDEHPKGPLSIAEVLKLSSNAGATRIILSLPPNQLWDLLHRVGFGEITGIGFPGEPDGVLTKEDPWKEITLATMGYGYGLSVTTLQLARAYLILAKQGVKIPITLFPQAKPPIGEQVIEPHIAKQMLLLLEEVVSGKGGTGERAKVPGFRVAGKTGTSWVAGKGGYQKKEYTSSFVGIAPVTNPKLVVAVVINNPKRDYYGGQVSGPVFEKAMEGTLRILGVRPDADQITL